MKSSSIKSGYSKQALALAVFCLVSVGAMAQIEKAVAAYARSIEKEKRQDYQGAIKSIADLNDSLSYENNLRLGWLHYKMGTEKQSLNYYRKAVKLQPQAIEPRIGSRYPAGLLEDMSEVIEQDKKILELDPNNKNTNSNLGLLYNYLKDYNKAVPHLQRVLKHYPFDYDNNLALGWSYLHLGKNDLAEKQFNTVLLYSPEDASAREGLENLGRPTSGDPALMGIFKKSHELANASDYKGASKFLKDNYDKNSYLLNIRLAWLCYLAGQHAESVQYYKTAAALNPESVEAKLGLALPLEAMGNKTELKGVYESVLALDPHNTVINYKLGLMYYLKKEYTVALPFFEKVVKLYPFDYDGLLMYAWTNYYADNYETARANFYKVLCLSPGDQSATQALTLKPLEEQKRLEQKDIIRPK